ncbi:unnamed protein product, partial [Nesidiocoris tenuis]
LRFTRGINSRRETGMLARLKCEADPSKRSRLFAWSKQEKRSLPWKEPDRTQRIVVEQIVDGFEASLCSMQTSERDVIRASHVRVILYLVVYQHWEVSIEVIKFYRSCRLGRVYRWLNPPGQTLSTLTLNIYNRSSNEGQLECAAHISSIFLVPSQIRSKSASPFKYMYQSHPGLRYLTKCKFLTFDCIPIIMQPVSDERLNPQRGRAGLQALNNRNLLGRQLEPSVGGLSCGDSAFDWLSAARAAQSSQRARRAGSVPLNWAAPWTRRSADGCQDVRLTRTLDFRPLGRTRTTYFKFIARERPNQ